MNYKIPSHILDLLMPIARAKETTPAKLIEEAILNHNYEGNVCLKSQQK